MAVSAANRQSSLCIGVDFKVAFGSQVAATTACCVRLPRGVAAAICFPDFVGLTRPRGDIASGRARVGYPGVVRKKPCPKGTENKSKTMSERDSAPKRKRRINGKKSCAEFADA